MGYRSDVSFCLRVKEPEQFVALMKLKENRVIKEFLEFMWLSEDTRVLPRPIVVF